MRRVVLVALLLLPAAQAGSVGDAVEYGTSTGTAQYAWGVGVHMPDRDGGTSLAWTLHVDDSTWWVLPDGHVVAKGSAQMGAPDPEDRHAWSIVYEDQPPDAVARRSVDYADAAAPCAMVIDRSAQRLLAPCTVDGIVVGEGTPVVSRSALGPAPNPSPGTLDVVWDEETYPERLQVGGAQEKRVAIVAGTSGLPAADVRAGPAWETAEPGPWGPSEQDMDHPWSRQDAYEYALSDVRLGDLKVWLAGRDVWPQAGSAHVIDDGVARMQTWTFTLSDGDEAFSFAVRRHADSPVVEVYPLDAPDPLPRDALPESWPTLDALHHRLAHHADPSWDVEATWWGYRVDPEHGLVFDIAHDISEAREGPVWFHQEASLRVTAHGRSLSFADASPGGTLDFPFAEAERQGPQGTIVDISAPATWHPIALGLGIGGLAIALRWVAWPLFTRIRNERLLDHPRRRKIHEAVEAQPGIHLSQLRRTLGMANGTLLHHLARMEKAGIVHAERAQGYTTYTLASVAQPWRRFLPLVQSDTARRITVAVAEGPHTIARLERLVGVAAPTLRWHLDRMTRGGLVQREAEGAAYRYALTAQAEGIAGQLQPSK